MGILEKIKKPTQTSKTEKKTESISVPEKMAKSPAKTGAPRAHSYGVILRSVLSEKTTQHEAAGQYTFAVSPKANKLEVKKAIEALYGVRPVSVNIVNVEGKTVRFGRTVGRRKDWKKAIVTLPKGKTISIHEGV